MSSVRERLRSRSLPELNGNRDAILELLERPELPLGVRSLLSQLLDLVDMEIATRGGR